MKSYVGRSRAENLDWLVNVWLANGPPVCFLQGFAGVGKTDLARDFRERAEKQQAPDKRPRWQHAVINEIADRPTPSVLESLMELAVTLSQQGLPELKRFCSGSNPPISVTPSNGRSNVPSSSSSTRRSGSFAMIRGRPCRR